MKYKSVKEISKEWNISDRRLRTLCSQGRIDGVILENGSYLIPVDAVKPDDKRVKSVDYASLAKYYLKWDNDCIGYIDDGYNVYFDKPKYNKVVEEYTKGKSRWSREEFEYFLAERIVSKDRRDIEVILFEYGFSRYEIIRLGMATHGICASDLLWIAYSKDDEYDDAITDVFKKIFRKKRDAKGSPVSSPEGFNVKRYGVYDGKYGLYKNRISPISTDIESEVAVYEIAKLMGVTCCPAYITGKDTVFSEFLYDFGKDFIVHFRRFAPDNRSGNTYKDLLSIRPCYKEEIVKMIALDFVTRQDDRHLSNIAVKIHKYEESFYPLYDNGRSLFYQDTEEICKEAVKDVSSYSTAFGPCGTYYDYVMDIKAERINFSEYVNLDISKEEIESALKKAGIKGYRYTASVKWISKCIKILKET